MPLTYDGNIPAATDYISASQPQIQGNFSAIQALVDIDHVDFAYANFGQHNRVTFNNQVSNPFGAGLVGLYSQVNATTGINEIYVNKAAGNQINPVAMSASVLSYSAPNPAKYNTFGWTYLPSGLLVYWGIGNVTSTSIAPVQKWVYPTSANIPTFGTAVFNVSVTTYAPAAVADPNTFVTLVDNTVSSLTGFSVIATARSSLTTSYVAASFSYIVIGY